MLDQLSGRELIWPVLYLCWITKLGSIPLIFHYPSKPMYIITIFNNHSLEMFMVKVPPLHRSLFLKKTMLWTRDFSTDHRHSVSEKWHPPHWKSTKGGLNVEICLKKCVQYLGGKMSCSSFCFNYRSHVSAL